MPLTSPEQGKSNDDMILQGVGIVSGIILGLLVLFSFLPMFIFAVVISIVFILWDKKYYLKYAAFVSVILLFIMIFLGDWQDLFQFTPLLFTILNLDQVIPYLESYINGGQSFQPTVYTYIYFIFLAIVFAHIGVYFYNKFQSRIVKSKKTGKMKEKETRQFQNVRHNWIKMNAKQQNSWRRKEGKKEKTDDVLLGIDQMGSPIKINYDELKQHTLTQGTTGSGKTTAIYTLLETALQNQDGFVMIDGKGDPETIEQVQSLFNAYGRKLHVFHSSRNLTYNPFKNGGYTAGTNHLFNAFDWSEQFYKNVTKEHTQNVMAFLDAYGFARDLKHIGKYLELKNIFNVLKSDMESFQTTETKRVPKQVSTTGSDELDVVEKDNTEYEEHEVTVTQHQYSSRAKKFMNLFFGRDDISEDEIDDVIKNMSGDLTKFIRGMTSQLNYIVHSEIGHLFEEKEDGIDLSDVISKGEGVIFSLNAMSYKDFIMRLGRFIIDDIATIIQEQGQKDKNDVLGIFDEFDSYGNEQITDILAKSRSANFRAVISVQSLAQLRLPEGDITQKVIDTCNTYFFGVTNDPNNAEYVASLIGTQEDEEQTIMTKEIGPGLGRLDFKTDYGTSRNVRNYYYHPDFIKELGMGEFVIRRKAAKDIENDEARQFVYFRNPIDGLDKLMKQNQEVT